VRVVLDTNIVVSGLLWRRAPRALLDAARDARIDLFTSAWLLDELSDVLPRAKLQAKVRASGLSPGELLAGYAQLARLVLAANVPPVVLADPEDDHVLACALAAQADLIVSGDSHLLNLKAYQGIPIVLAADALRLIGSVDTGTQ